MSCQILTRALAICSCREYRRGDFSWQDGTDHDFADSDKPLAQASFQDLGAPDVLRAWIVPFFIVYIFGHDAWSRLVIHHNKNTTTQNPTHHEKRNKKKKAYWTRPCGAHAEPQKARATS